ncbi:MAG: YqiJ family protein [Gammaproteobacteria bacterium]|nr:YqiJ family protein [Gammaproteobacteria bacterium]
MLEFALEAANRPFAAAIGLMLAIAVLEGVLALIGAGIFSFLDSLVPDVDADADVDLDVPQSDISGSGPDYGDTGIRQITANPTNLPARILGWLYIGKVPLLILLVMFLLVFGLSGYIMQAIVNGMFGVLLHGSIAWIPPLVLTIPVVRVFGKGFAKIIPKDQSSAVDSSTFVGRIATITLGTARKGMPAQAKLTDQHGLSHYVMVEPDNKDEEFERGSSVLLIQKTGSQFVGVRNTSEALTDD